MNIVISGLNKDDCSQAFTPASCSIEVTWIEPHKFIQLQAEQVSMTGIEVLVWIYSPPWTTLSASSKANISDQQMLQSWLTQQRSVLQLKKKLGPRLLLVNAERMHSASLEAHLLGQKNLHISHSKASSSSSELLAKLFAWVAPECWDIVEALEAAAWLPNGSPLFRNALESPDKSVLIELMNRLQEGARVPALRTELQETGRQLQSTREALEQTEASLQKLEYAASVWTRDRQMLTSEKDTLARQLLQVQAQLEELHLHNQTELIQLVRNNDAIATANASSEQQLVEVKRQLVTTQLQLEQSQQAYAVLTRAKAEALAQADLQFSGKLQEQRKTLKDVQTQTVAHARTLTEKNLLLQRQLHQIQAELEQYYLANREMQSVMADATQTMHLARSALINAVPTTE